MWESVFTVSPLNAFHNALLARQFVPSCIVIKRTIGGIVCRNWSTTHGLCVSCFILTVLCHCVFPCFTSWFYLPCLFCLDYCHLCLVITPALDCSHLCPGAWIIVSYCLSVVCCQCRSVVSCFSYASLYGSLFYSPCLCFFFFFLKVSLPFWNFVNFFFEDIFSLVLFAV